MAPLERLRSGFADMPWKVHKFGGTSVADASCFVKVAEIVEGQLDSSSELHLCCVVSAMGGKPKTTDLLIESVSAAAARNGADVENKLDYVLRKHEMCLKELFPQGAECERLLSIVQKDLEDIRDILKTVSLMKWKASRISELVSGYGELWSTQILTAFLQSRQTGNRVFVYLDARRVITVDEDAIQDGAVVWKVSGEKMNDVYQKESAAIKSFEMLHFVATGYVASNTDGVATTLQRDGSDYSAAILGRLLSANSITIWTDVDGCLSADPRRVPLAQVLPEISFNEAMELSFFGAKVIHPKTMQPAISATPQIPIYIRNTFNASFPGTRIFTSGAKDNDKIVSAFSSIEHMAIVNVEGSGLVGT
jgi:bifunctional aspartokinase / homoserine dehydrogenase 1